MNKQNIASVLNILIIMLLMILTAIMLIGCGKNDPDIRVNVEVVDGLELDFIEGDDIITEYYVIVNVVDDDPAKLYKVKVPIKNKYAKINSILNYPKGSILNVNEKDLRWYVKTEYSE